ncbi:TPA: LysR family transcriptional regulator AmpR [Klebsiella aerogenes]|nr:LysR family transcriptional regulator AmpR [Klebsiella aerogenes]HDS3657895.1 LysR family transcriptional regulator AmpR [Klebsiella aerogenes]HDT6523148.1 LysR family transcriptional regulator AmpR [Klebsiella aerogenes]HDT6527030.1 LysR family transcriptional regulator AmpR [Klebsiella aerogenes]
MTRSYLPLNSLRAFEAAARHLSFTRAAIELNVTHSAISQHVKTLEEHLNCQLFVRVSRGLKLTTEGEGLLPVLNESFERIAGMLDRFTGHQAQEKLKIGVVGTFATGVLFPLLPAFWRECPHIDLQISTHNNRVDPAAEGLDYVIRFGGGAWHDTAAQYLCAAPLSALCAPSLAARLNTPKDILQFTLLRSYRRDEWSAWMQAAGELPPSPTHRVIVFDSSVTMLEAAQAGLGVAIAPAKMFSHLLEEKRIVQPFKIHIDLGNYWLTRLQSRPETPAMLHFSRWLAEVLKGVNSAE